MESTDSHDAQVQVPNQLPQAGSAVPAHASPAHASPAHASPAHASPGQAIEGSVPAPAPSPAPASAGIAKPGVFAPGTIVGASYEVIELLGRGAMGMVYRVKHVTLPAEYALKILTDDKQDDVSVIRFQNEAQAIAKLNHPNIVAIYNFGLHEGSLPFYVMDLLAGEDLLDKIAYSGPMAPDMALPLFIEACAGLSFAHRKGILHRDVKPANLLILDRPDVHGASVKVVDFGIVKFAEELKPDSQKLTAMGIVCGSPSYMSPEQAMGQKVDPRSDIYSLGCSLFETLTGKVPFRGRSASDTMMMHVSAPSPSLSSKNPEAKFSDDLEILVARMMAKERMYRYQTMDAVAQDLKNLLEGKPLASTPFVQSNFGVTQGKAEGAFESSQAQRNHTQGSQAQGNHTQGNLGRVPAKPTARQDEPLFDGRFTGDDGRFTGEQDASGEYESEESDEELDEDEVASPRAGLVKMAVVSMLLIAVVGAVSYFAYNTLLPGVTSASKEASSAVKVNIDMNYLAPVMNNIGATEPDPKAASIKLTDSKYFSKRISVDGQKFIQFDFPAKSGERPLAWIGTSMANRNAAVGILRIPFSGRICLVPTPDTLLKPEFFAKFRQGDIAEVIINNSYSSDQIVCASAKIPGLNGFSIMNASMLSAKVIPALNSITGLTDLTLQRSRFSASELAKLNCWLNLKKLALNKSQHITSALKHLSGSRNLEVLDLTDCGIGPQDYRLISNLPNLYSLRLDQNQLTNADLRSLSKLPRLAELSLVDAQIKDYINAKDLQQFPALRVLYVESGRFKKEDLTRIYERCPNLRVHFYAPATTDSSQEMIFETPASF